MRIRKRKPIGKKTIKYIEKLYEAYSRKLFCIAKNHVKDDDLAQDVVQSVFEKALVYPESILKVPEEEVFYFLTAITKNESFTLLKNEKNNEHESLTYEDGSEGDFVEDPRDNYLQMIDLASLKQNLAALPRRHRDTILFRKEHTSMISICGCMRYCQSSRQPSSALFFHIFSKCNDRK